MCVFGGFHVCTLYRRMLNFSLAFKFLLAFLKPLNTQQFKKKKMATKLQSCNITQLKTNTMYSTVFLNASAQNCGFCIYVCGYHFSIPIVSCVFPIVSSVYVTPALVLIVSHRERLPSWTGPSCPTHRTSVPVKDTSVVSVAVWRVADSNVCWRSSVKSTATAFPPV